MKPSIVGMSLLLLVAAACGQGTATQQAGAPLPFSEPTPSPTASRVVPTPKPDPDHQARHRHHHGKQRERLTQPIALPDCPNTPSPHFDTPEAAMTYLAAAWNRNDLAALCHVTNPNSRELLNNMHEEATNLRLSHCKAGSFPYYDCTFDHDYPRSWTKKAGKTGHAWFQAGPADTPGWYMTIYEGCG